MNDLTNKQTLRVFVVTQDDPLYVAAFFSEFLTAYHSNTCAPVELVGAMIQKPLGNKTKRGLVKRVTGLYGMFGTIRIAGRVLRVKITHHTVRGLLNRYGIPIYHGENVNDPGFSGWVRDNSIDLIVSVAAAQIFKEEILRTPRLGCINLHNAPLPDYRGMLPNFWQMFHGETRSVLTIHQMVRELDKGDILLQRTTPIEPGQSLDHLMVQTKRGSAQALCELLRRMAAGPVEATPLADKPGSYFTFPTRADVQEFRSRGYRVL